MKVILLETTSGVGTRGSIVEVSEGFARNFLLPRRRAALATTEIVNAAARDAEARKAKTDRERKHAADLVQRLQHARITITARATDKGSLFAAITSSAVSQALSKQGFDVQPAQVAFVVPIRNLGNHSVTINVTHDATAVITVTVIAE